MLEVKLSKNLRKSILQGHPWLYKDSIESVAPKTTCQICRILDSKKQFLAWGFYDPFSPIAIRILSLEKLKPTDNFFEERIYRAILNRSFLDKGITNAYRLINGEADHLPGFVCDIYNKLAVMQFDGEGPSEFWPREKIAKYLIDKLNLDSVIYRPRDKKENISVWGQEVSEYTDILENKALFKVNILKGQKTGFFFDQRDNRDYVKGFAKNNSMLNLFSYTGGFSVYAGIGGASHVISLDVAKDALEDAENNWVANGLEKANHEIIKEDAFQFIKDTKDKWDMVIVDPPSMAYNKKNKAAAVAKYTEVFSDAAKKVQPSGHLCLSSCSSHISFDDFSLITEEALSKARRRAQILRISGQGADHPFLHILPEQRYLKFYHLVLD